MRYRLFLLLWVSFWALRLPAQDRLLLQAEGLRGEMHQLELSLLRATARAPLERQYLDKVSEMRALWQAQEQKFAGNTVIRGPKVKAPEGALALLRHERHAILDYFLGEKMLHAFVITRKETYYFVVPLLPGFKTKISAFLCQISTHDQLGDVKTFREKSNLLYQQFIEPLADYIEEIDQLTIITDPELRFFPFEVLVRPDESKENDFRTLPYLLQDYGIGYAFSVAHLARMQEQKLRPQTGIALVQGNITTLELGEIAYYRDVVFPGWETVPEAGAFAELTSLADSRQSLVQVVGSPTAAMQPQPGKPSQTAKPVPDLSGMLVTISGANNEGCIRLNELSNLTTVLNLETAHTNCIVTPIWNSTLLANRLIMQNYYQQLDDRQYVDQALRFARLAYLKQAHEIFTHPHYWAGYMQFNNFTAVKSLPNFPWYLLLFGGLLLIILLGKKL